MSKAVIFLGLYVLIASCGSSPEEQQKPNVIYILADDLGYGELGIYGQEKIQTPHIDALARTGMRFTQHYSGAPVCAPSRYVLLTGKHTGHAYIRGNDEWNQRGDVWDFQAMLDDSTLEGQRPIPASTVTLGGLLQQNGYTTGIFGKWGLGAPETEGVPNTQGFDSFYGYNCQRQAHNLFPTHLWNNEQRIMLANSLLIPHEKTFSPKDPYDEKEYAKFTQQDYAPGKIHEAALDFLENNQEEPFFLYYASPLPHLPLQVPKAYVNRYREIFGEEEPYLGDNGYFPNRYPRATYAGMISYLDDQVGELVAKLKEIGQYENTIIFFSSDNGPTYTGGVDFEFFESSAPFTNGYGRTKGFVYEGGVRVPMIVSWPEKISSGTTSDHLSAFYDVVPTVCELTNTSIPEGIDGLSFKAELLNKDQQKADHIYWEFPSYKGQQAIRMGKWKGVRKNIQEGNLRVELYDLENDPGEVNDISKDFPEVVQTMEQIMEEEHAKPENDKFYLKGIDFE